MAVKVRCRCGQELQLRYGEWVYVLLGLVLLCVVLNALGLLLLYLRLDELQEPRPQPPSAPGATADNAEPNTSGAVVGVGSRPPAADRTRSKRSGGSDEIVESAASPDGASRRREPVLTDPPTPPELREELRDSPEPRALGAVEREPSPARGMEEVLRSDAASSTGMRAPAESPGTLPAPRDVLEDVWKGVPLIDGAPPVVRLCLLENVPGDLAWRLGFLLDPDARVRRRAFERVRAYQGRASAEAEALSSAALGVARAASRWLDSPDRDPAMARALRELFPATAAPRELAEADELESVRAMLRVRLRAFSKQEGARELATRLVELDAAGVDVVLLVDVSRSMREPLQQGRRELRWLWPALDWGLPGARVGLVLYRDEVVLSSGFAVPVEDQITRASEVEIAGGGDVPEGVGVALELALSRGDFPWREGAAKHIVVFGDAPPRYEVLANIASLLRSARSQEGIRVHTLGTRPEAGRDDVPFFSDLARAGGGRTRTIEPAELGDEVLRCLLDRSSGEEIDALSRRLAAMFES